MNLRYKFRRILWLLQDLALTKISPSRLSNPKRRLHSPLARGKESSPKDPKDPASRVRPFVFTSSRRILLLLRRGIVRSVDGEVDL